MHTALLKFHVYFLPRRHDEKHKLGALSITSGRGALKRGGGSSLHLHCGGLTPPPQPESQAGFPPMSSPGSLPAQHSTALGALGAAWGQSARPAFPQELTIAALGSRVLEGTEPLS